RRGGLPWRGGGCPQGTTRRLPVRRAHLAGWYSLISPDHLLSKSGYPATVGANLDVFAGFMSRRAASARHNASIVAGVSVKASRKIGPLPKSPGPEIGLGPWNF